jgi:hypothetical protein
LPAAISGNGTEERLFVYSRLDALNLQDRSQIADPDADPFNSTYTMFSVEFTSVPGIPAAWLGDFWVKCRIPGLRRLLKCLILRTSI